MTGNNFVFKLYLNITAVIGEKIWPVVDSFSVYLTALFHQQSVKWCANLRNGDWVPHVTEFNCINLCFNEASHF
jgi:hypothetical protein